MIDITHSFCEYLDKRGIPYKYIGRPSRSDLVVVKYVLDNGRPAEFLVFFENDNCNAAIRCYTQIRSAGSSRVKGLELLNKLNPRFRFVKLYLDEDEIVAGCDMLLPEIGADEICFDYLETLICVVNDNYDAITAEIYK